MWRVFRRLQRLRDLSVDEGRERLRQRASALAERLGLRDAGEPSPAEIAGRVRPKLVAGSGDRLWSQLRGLDRPGFFPGAARPAATAAEIQRRWPSAAMEAVQRADEVVDGRFSLLGFPPFSCGATPDWWVDASSGVRSPARHWRSIDYLSAAVVGDHKVVWELNRHQFLVTLAIAWQHTRNEKYAERAVSLLESWMNANPPKIGINWASSLEVGLRLIAWTWTLHLLRDASSLTDTFFRRWLGFIDVSARHVERYLSTYFSPNTHLTSEALALLYVGTQFPELRCAEGWKARGLRVLLEQLPRQIRPDGTYFEQATYYHRYTLDIYLHARVLAAGAHLPRLAEIDEALARLADVLAWVSRPDGTFPLIGDDDGGKLLFLDGRSTDDARSSLGEAAVLLDRADLRCAAGPPTEELAWMLGVDALARFDALPGRAPATTARAFRDGGLFVVRDGWNREASSLVIDCGPLGAGSGGHGHADALGIDLTVAGRPVFVDPGTVSYAANDDRNAARHSRAHNTVSVDGESSSLPWGMFGWRMQTDGVLDVWHSAAPGVCFEGWHDGYRRLPEGVRHRRTVVVAGEWWIVRDEVRTVEGTPHDHLVEAAFQCAAGLSATSEGPMLRVVSGAEDVAVVTALCAAGQWVVDQGRVSRRYGSAEPAPRARFVFQSGDTEAATFVIVPGAGSLESATRDRVGQGEVIRIRDARFDDLLLFGVAESVDGLRTDARVAWVRRERARGTVESVFTTGGTFLELDGTPVARPDGAPLSATWDQGEWRVTSSAAFQTARA